MTDNAFFDIETVSGQAALLAQTRDAIEAIGAVAASSPDDLVRVWVTPSGSVVDIDLGDASRRLDCDELARLIVATAQQAAQNAAALQDAARATRPPAPPTDDPFSFYQPLHDTAPNDDW